MTKPSPKTRRIAWLLAVGILAILVLPDFFREERINYRHCVNWADDLDAVQNACEVDLDFAFCAPATQCEVLTTVPAYASVPLEYPQTERSGGLFVSCQPPTVPGTYRDASNDRRAGCADPG